MPQFKKITAFLAPPTRFERVAYRLGATNLAFSATKTNAYKPFVYKGWQAFCYKSKTSKITTNKTRTRKNLLANC